MAITQYKTDYYANEIIQLKTGGYVTSISELANWSQYFPYKLIIANAVAGDNGSGTTYTPLASFVLPISPQDLSISMPFATSLTPTLGGVVEQHNGAPFRDISLQGTTGVNLVKNSAYSGTFESSAARIATEFFPREISSATKIYDAGQKLIGRFGQDIYNVNPAGNDNSQTSGELNYKSTGYYQILALRSFLEFYAEAKRKNTRVDLTPIGSQQSVFAEDLRLILAIERENDWYLCSGVSFSVRRSANDPFIYNYGLALRSFKRIQANSLEGPSDNPVRSVNDLRRQLDQIRQAGDILNDTASAISKIPGSIRDNINSGIRTFSVVSKSFLGIPLSIADLPNTVQRELEGIGNDFKRAHERLDSQGKYALEQVDKLIKRFGPKNPANQSQPTENKDALTVGDNQNDSGFNGDEDLNNLGIPLPASLNKKIESYRQEQLSKTRTDLLQEAEGISEVSDSLASIVGKMPTKYAETFGIQPNYVDTELSISDFSTFSSLLNVQQGLYSLAANAPSKEDTFPRTMDYLAGIASGAGLAFQRSISKFAVPFPYGATLERLALTYLGDKDRWHEIAVLNGLQEPFVDEEGWTIELLSNGNRNNIVITDTNNVFMQQSVWIYSATKPREKRTVLNIKKTGSSLLLTLSGNPDLDKFRKNDGARLEGFLPNTVNSQKILFIPSSVNIPDQGVFDTIPGVDYFDPLLQIAGTDLLLDNEGDLILTPDGGTKLAYGLQNIIQQVKIALSTERGSILSHPNFGTTLPLGMSTADVVPSKIMNDIKSMFSDSNVFTGVSSLSIQKNGPYIKVALVIGIKGLGKEVPITFNV